jgi:Protein of unknown function (DUF4197)
MNAKNEITGCKESPERRRIVQFALLTAACLVLPGRQARAFSIADLSNADAGNGVKTALERGATIAVALLGKEDGFWKNDAVRIALPEWLQKAEKVIKLIGKSADVEALKLGVNRAAEQAVPAAKTLLVDSVRSMSVQDAKSILTGGDNSVTAFFKDKTRTPLTEKFTPIVGGVTQRIGLAQQYNQLAGQVQKTGMVKLKPDQATIESHVTTRALDGLYYMIGEEEKKIRRDPVGTGSDILKKVFGSLR